VEKRSIRLQRHSLENAGMNSEDVKRHDVRRQAEDRFAKIMRRDAEVMAYQQQQWKAEAAKIARLRALRLARDAADAKPADAPPKPAAASRTKAARTVKIPKRSSGTVSTGDKA